MWPFSRSSAAVTCIACGQRCDRDDAREYDKYGDRWERTEKSFEYLCKPCDRELCRSPRDGVESVLVDLDVDESTPEAFVRAYMAELDARRRLEGA